MSATSAPRRSKVSTTLNDTMRPSMETWRSACEIAELIRAKKLSPVEATEAALARIDALNPTLNAFCLVAAEQARAAAREAEIAVTKGEPLGPLHGEIGRASCRERV